MKPEKKNGIKKGAKAESIKIAKKLLKMEMKIEEIIKDDCKHSRVPVYDETIDEIKGILYVKDIIKNMNSQEVNTQPTSHDMAVSIIKNMNFDIYKDYDKLTAYYKKIVLDEIERVKKEHEQHNNEVKC